MAITISVSLQKGGTGKTTTVQSIGSILGKKGYKVLLVDCDSQANLSYSAGVDYESNNLTIYEVLSGQADITKAIHKKANYDIVPAYITLDNALTELKPSEADDLVLLRRVLDPIKENYDFIIIDSGPSMNVINVNVLVACDYVIIPVEPSTYAMQGIIKLMNVIKNVKKANPKLSILGVLLVKYKYWTNGHQEIKEYLQGFLNNVHIKLFETTISDSVSVSNSQGSQIDLVDYEPKSKPALQYTSLVDEILKELNLNE